MCGIWGVMLGCGTSDVRGVDSMLCAAAHADSRGGPGRLCLVAVNLYLYLYLYLYLHGPSSFEVEAEVEAEVDTARVGGLELFLLHSFLPCFTSCDWCLRGRC